MQQGPSDSKQEGNVLGKCCSYEHRRCGLRKGRANLVDDDGLSKEREQKHVFAMSL
jgi:hypothetical protein